MNETKKGVANIKNKIFFFLKKIMAFFIKSILSCMKNLTKSDSSSYV